MLNMNVDEYLSILDSTSPTNHPFMAEERGEELGAAFQALTEAFAAFVRLGRQEGALGYKATRANLVSLVEFLPNTPNGEGPLEALLVNLAEAQDDVADDEA